MSVFPIQPKVPFCQCLHETENNLERTKHCFMPCENQHTILTERVEMLKKAEPLVKDLEIAIKNKTEATVIAGSKKFTMQELLDEIKNMTPFGRLHVKAWLKAQERTKK